MINKSKIAERVERHCLCRAGLGMGFGVWEQGWKDSFSFLFWGDFLLFWLVFWGWFVFVCLLSF